MTTHYSLTYEKRRERNYKMCFVCRTGNIETISTVSAVRCIKKHLRKIGGG